MTAIDCNTNAAYTLIMNERDALAIEPNAKSKELWRVRLNDCHAIAYRGKVLPQGTNQQRIADLLAELVNIQESLL